MKTDLAQGCASLSVVPAFSLPTACHWRFLSTGGIGSFLSGEVLIGLPLRERLGDPQECWGDGSDEPQ